ncbi:MULTISPECIES: WG repeat-containing protein [Aquimarina]|uniref:WG repeat-containing protein n=1 Tax=Aquimarina TaxID=290174 RepID=UPI0003FB1E3B|nr:MULTISPECIES: WG repeat-containing protein [Aquimarina]
MKKFVITLLLIPYFGIAQTLENLDYISPFHNEVASVKKGSQWGFIDLNGKLIVDFRDDLVLTKTDNANYPIFKNDRCLITHQKDGVLYYGYINKKGVTIIKPQFLNAINFNEGKALALTVHKEIIGYNDIFKKDVVNYHYFEVVIDSIGTTIDHLSQLAIHISPKYTKRKNPPPITSKLVSTNLVAVKGNDDKWQIKKIN